MKINRIITGTLEENCYIIEIDNKVLVLDPGADYDKIKASIGNKTILGVLITHNHFDHVGTLSYFTSYKIMDYNNLEEKEYKIGPFNFEVIYTSGHTSDSVSYYFYEDNALFTGDFIFKDALGRTDFPTGSDKDMASSIVKISNYPASTIVYPGHGPKTILGKELKFYLK